WRWKAVPWVAYEWPMEKDELELNFGAAVTALIQLDNIEAEPDNEGDHEGSEKTTTKGAWVYEIWDKANRRIIFYCPSYPEGVLKALDDPLELTGFFSTPEPLQFVRKISSLVPVALYELYRNQAKELNLVTVRISRLTEALKVRGFYDQQIEGLPKLLEADDNT